MLSLLLLLLGFLLLSDFQLQFFRFSILIVIKLRLLIGDNIPDFRTVSDFYRAVHLSAYARSWDRMSYVRPSVRLSVCL